MATQTGLTTFEFERGELLRKLKLPPRCPFCGKYVRCYYLKRGAKTRLYPDDDPDGIIAECYNCGQIDGFMEENPTSLQLLRKTESS